ncbi:M81 family metallopeptidase [Arvimicrobium flavum]|uniref:M81 family metallopeptidase n=1 Tax=Arvimicrobium flavum TaxID=3393320 RepID=UPI00237BAA56|nr:M81 family metallopeptidase [Mesorhizobium shangrilense]
MRIAIGGFIHETNTFAPAPTVFEDFGDWLGNGIPVGKEIFERTPKTIALRGVSARARDDGHELVPLIHAPASPANKLTEDCFERISAMLIERIGDPTRLDGVILDLHGAMVAKHHSDADAEILRRVRSHVGPNVPVVASLDLHGNVTPEMITIADGLVGYRTYPHVDMYQTGERAYELFLALKSDAPPKARGFRSIPFLMPIHRQTTMNSPCSELYASLARHEAECGDGAKLSFMMGFTLADVNQCRPSLYGFGADQQKLDRALDAMLEEILDCEAEFHAALPSADEAVAEALRQPEGVTVLADVQDNAGGGGTSDTIWVLESLLKAKAKDAVVGLMFDPEAAKAAHAAGLGADIEIPLGGKGMPGHAPLVRSFRVAGLHDGVFRLKGPMMAGSDQNLGKMAWLVCDGVGVVVTSVRTWYVERESFAITGAVPEEHRIVSVKSTNHYRADFTELSSRIIELGAPGAVTLDPSKLSYKNLQPGTRLYGTGPAFQPAKV